MLVRAETGNRPTSHGRQQPPSGSAGSNAEGAANILCVEYFLGTTRLVRCSALARLVVTVVAGSKLIGAVDARPWIAGVGWNEGLTGRKLAADGEGQLRGGPTG